MGTGFLLMGLGFLFAFIGNIGFANVARQEGDMYAMLCKFVPLYKWYFLVSRWSLMKEHIVFYSVGLLMLYPGLILWRTAPSLADDGSKAKPAARAAAAPAPRGDDEDEEDAPPVAAPVNPAARAEPAPARGQMPADRAEPPRAPVAPAATPSNDPAKLPRSTLD
jgi:hypothetical protein